MSDFAEEDLTLLSLLTTSFAEHFLHFMVIYLLYEYFVQKKLEYALILFDIFIKKI